MKLLSTQRVWDHGEHNAFTDLCFFDEHLWLAFREASNHVSPDGKIIIINSCDGKEWTLKAELSISGIDLRDPKLTITPDQQLLMNFAGVDRLTQQPLQSYLTRSSDGTNWSSFKAVGEANYWIWRTRFLRTTDEEKQAYGAGYFRGDENLILYRLDETDQFQQYLNPLFSTAKNGLGYPNEYDFCQLEDNTALCLLRRDADTATAQLGRSQPPFIDWQWQDLDKRIGGPVMIKLTDQRLLTAVRLYNPARTSLCWLDTKTAKLTEEISLPSGGDTSYAGLVQQGNTIWCSYYSSHEEKAAIYVAELSLT
jgi:hypothetical protein